MVVRINKEGNYKQTKKVSNLLNKEKFLAFRDKHIKIFKKMKKKINQKQTSCLPK